MKFKFIRKNIFAAFALSFVLALFSCANEVGGGNVVGETYAFPDATKIAGAKFSAFYGANGGKARTIITFFLEGWEDVPFIRLDDVANLLYYINDRGYDWNTSETQEGLYTYMYDQSGKTPYPAAWKNDTLYFDAKNQKIYSDDFTRIITPTRNVNNGIGTVYYDTGTASAKTPAISESDKTVYVKQKERTVIDLGKYGLKMFVFDTTKFFTNPAIKGYEKDLLIPFQVIADMFFRCVTCSYNGTDYYACFDTSSDNYATNKAYDSGRNPRSSRSQLKAEYNYRNLCLLFDMNYCLKEQRTAQKKDNIGEFINDSIFNHGLGFGLLSTDTATYDTYLYKFLTGYIDDGHTSYSEPSMYQSMGSVNQYKEAAYKASGPRGAGLDAIRKKLTKLRSDKIKEDNEKAKEKGEEEKKAQDVFYVKDGDVEKMAVIAFNGFVGNDPDTSDLEKLANSNTYAFFKKVFADIATHTSVKNVVFDLSCNGGGLIQQCMISLCFLEDPSNFYMAEKNHLDNTVTKFYCNVGENLKQTGKHFYVLTSGFSFSCGNFFPSICHYQLGVPIIGQRSGGGGGVVQPSQTSDGALFNTSASAEMCALDANDNYISIDDGVPIDLEIPYDKFYSGTSIYKDLYETIKADPRYAGNFN